MRGAAGIGAHHFQRAVMARARHGEFDVAELRQQVPAVAPVAPVGLLARRHRRQVAIDRRLHAARQDRLQGIRRGVAVVLGPFDAITFHGLHHPERSR